MPAEQRLDAHRVSLMDLLLKTPEQVVEAVEAAVLRHAHTPMPAIGRPVEVVNTEDVRRVFQNAREQLARRSRVFGED